MEQFSEPLVWQVAWSVGNDLMDEQHKKLIEYINQLIEINNILDESEENNENHDLISNTFTRLIEYTETHFKDEEQILHRYNYPGLHNHKVIHENFCKQLYMLKDKFEHHGVKILPTLVKFLGEWLVSHILVTDKKYTSIVGQRDVPQ